MKPTDLTVRVKVGLAATLMALLMAACGGTDAEDSGDSSAESAGSPEATSTHSEHGDGTTVEMSLIQFRPKQLEVAQGTEVTWIQNDAGFHTVSSGTVDQGSGGVTVNPDGNFDSGRISSDQSFKFTFNEPGTYPYFCEIHPATMTGEVTVGS